jgi:hypothetical protein
MPGVLPLARRVVQKSIGTDGGLNLFSLFREGVEIMKKIVVAAMSIAALLLTAPGASAQVCIVGTIVAAISANARDNRELTAQEAAWCGVPFFFEAPKPQKKKPERQAKKR